MSGHWRFAFDRLTNKADLYRTAVIAFVFSGIATVVSAPNFYYLISEVSQENLSDAITYHLVAAQLVILFIVCSISVTAGISLGARYQLPGIGIYRQYVYDLPFITALGFVLLAVSFIFFDRFFYEISPVSYPSEFLFLVAIPFKGAFTEEIILRLGLVTIGVGICKNKTAGVVLVAVFAAFLSIKYLGFAGIKMDFSYIFIAQILYTFLLNCILGILFVSRGLIYAMTVKFIIGLKYLLIALSM